VIWIKAAALPIGTGLPQREVLMLRFAAVSLLVVLTGPAAFAVEVGDPARGLAYARVNCSECHAVEPREMISPFSDVPPFREIANTPGISELALIAFFQTPHPTMPDLVVPSADIRDLVAYIVSLKN
jgi:mono/diheme cytochrome c family protein